MITVKKGAIVDIVAPASHCSIEEFKFACEQLLKWGLQPRCHVNFEKVNPFHSDDDEIRYKDFVRALNAKDSKIIWCLRGGYGSARILSRLNKIKKPKNKKLIIGYSDITSLHTFLNDKWNWESIHGPMMSSLFPKRVSDKSKKEIKELILGNKKEFKFAIRPMNKLAKTLSKIEGKMAGGNLATLQTSIGTPFQFKSSGKILFLEDVGERGYKVDRMLYHLQSSNALKGIKAIVFGDFSNGDETSGENHIKFALKRFAELVNVPVYRSSEFGHGKVNRPLLFGHTSRVKKVGTKFQLEYFV